MPAPTHPQLQTGRVYRTADLAAWGKNPSRLARRLEQTAHLQRLGRGMFVCPHSGRFGATPPTDEELLRSLLNDGPYLVTGPERWNTLGLGSTALFAHRLVYNTKRSGKFELGGAKFLLRRVPFPAQPTPEWFVVDLFENHAMAGVSLDDLCEKLERAVASGRFEPERLQAFAREYGTKQTQALVEEAVTVAA